jgi:hypothetical protein
MLIGIAGRARSGKDTIAAYLVEKYGFQQYSFATPMKDFLQDMFQWDDRHTDGDLKDVLDPVWGFSPREALQLFGTEFGRACHPDIWLKFAAIQLDDFGEDGQNVVISDVRFDNEAWFCRDRGVLIHVIKPYLDKINGVSGHESERGVTFEPQTDHFFLNDSSIAALEATVDAFMEARDV